MKERLKQFKKDHEDAIFVMSSMAICVATGVLTSVLMTRQVDVLRVNQNQQDPNNFRIKLSNGKVSYWSIAPKA